jgi:hypothetical protein
MLDTPVKSWKYRGYTLDSYRSGWFTANTDDGFIKADTLDGLKKLVDERARNDYQLLYMLDDNKTVVLIHEVDGNGQYLSYEVERLDKIIKPLREVNLYHDDARNLYYFNVTIRGQRYRIPLHACTPNYSYNGRYDY